jgi:hypothetical protein
VWKPGLIELNLALGWPLDISAGARGGLYQRTTRQAEESES